MFFTRKDIVFKEIPNHISLCFSIAGCQKECKGCHSKELWYENPKTQTKLDTKLLKKYLKKYIFFIDSVCFLGGDWHKQKLISFLKIIKENDLITCLYTAENYIENDLIPYLNYIKIGKYIESKGGLENLNTNQKFINLKTNENLNYLFQK